MSNHSCDCCCTCKEKEITPRMVKFDKGGIYEWKVPKNAWYEVTVTGAGGAGGSAMITAAPAAGWISVVGGAGGAGGTAQKSVYLLKDDIVSITVGRGGKNSKQIAKLGELLFEPGGEKSSFGNYCFATGGNGGETQSHAMSVARRPGNSGVGINGDINIVGGKAIPLCSYSQLQNQNLQFFSPGCSPSIYGGLGKMKFFSSNGENGLYGAGGEGAVAQSSSKTNMPDPDMINKPFYGGDGGDGIVLIRWFEFQ